MFDFKVIQAYSDQIKLEIKKFKNLYYQSFHRITDSL